MKYWTESERTEAFRLRRFGLTYAVIASKIPGRTTDSIRMLFSARGKTAKQTRLERQARTARREISHEACASEQLRIATITAIDRYAGSRGICIDTAARQLLSGVAA